MVFRTQNRAATDQRQVYLGRALLSRQLTDHASLLQDLVPWMVIA